MLKKAFKTILGQCLEVSKIYFSEIKSGKVICNDWILDFDYKKKNHCKERRTLVVYRTLMKMFIDHSTVNLATGHHCILCQKQFLFYLFASSTFIIAVLHERLFWYDHFNCIISLSVIVMNFLQLYNSCMTLRASN